MMASLFRDVRYSLRALRQTPAFTLGAIVTVALTVGATTAIFSVVHGVLLRQLPFRNVQRVFWIWSDQPGRDRTPFNVPDFIDFRDSARTLSGFAGFFAYSANLSDEAAAERVQGIRATGNLFDVLGAQARVGRLLQPSDERPGAEPVVVLAEPFWMRRFGGDRAVVGRQIRLNSEQYTIAGVLPAGFAMPVRDVEFVLPFAADRDLRRGARNSVNFIQGVGRLQTSRTQAADDLTAIARRLQVQFPVENARKRGVRMVGLMDGVVGPFRTALLTLFAAVGAVLLIACANLANLMLTRAASRRRDHAVQLALGSSRVRVVRQILVEASIVGVSGGVLGVLVAEWGVPALAALAPVQLPRSGEIRVDVAVLMFSLAVSSLTGVILGVIPAVTSASVDVRDALQGSSRGATDQGRLRLGGKGRGSAGRGLDIRGLDRLHVREALPVPVAQFRTVSPGYFEAARIPLRRARTFSERDTGRTRAVAVVNEELARQWLQGLDPIGARLLVDDNDGPPRPVEVIGVVGNVQQVALDEAPTWDLYLTYPQIHPDNAGAAAANMFWIVRTTRDPLSLAASLAREVRRLDREVVAAQIRPMDQYLSDSVAPRRFSLALMSAFGVSALALAITGIYAVVTYSIGRRAQEIGIRVALGSGRWSIVRLVMGHGIRSIIVGLAVGTAMAAGVTRLLSSMLFGLAATDAATFGEVAVVVVAVSVLACAVPAARVSKLVVGVLKAE